MLSKAFNLLKRKRHDGTATQNNQESVDQNGNVFSRAFLRIKRRILRVCQPRTVHALCIEMSPQSLKDGGKYEVTPALTQRTPAEHLPREYVWNEFVSVRESRNFEFKTGGGAYPIQILPEHIRKYGTAFLNCDGGVLIAGILDNGLVRGVFCDRRMEDRIRCTLNREVSQFYPQVEPNLYSVRFVPVYDRRTRLFIRDTKVIEIVFKGGDPLALYESGEHKVFLKREGSVDGPLSPLQIKDVVLRKYRKVLEDRRAKDITLLSP